MLAASREEAVLAVKLYNDPTGDRTLEGFVVHMHLAWLYLLQTEWTKAKKDYRIPDKARKGWFKKIEGEYQTPSLEWFVQQTWVDSNPVRANIEFFIRLRNKIEHRHSGSDESLAAVIAGECHALLVNYEESLTTVGGPAQSLATVLKFPVFVGGFTDKGKDSLLKLTKKLPADLRKFLVEYNRTIDDEVTADPRYALRLKVFLESGNRSGDLSLKFYKADDLTEEQRKALDAVGSQGVVITKHKQIPVANLGNMKAKEVVDLVQSEIPFVFNMNHFTQAYKVGEFRPPTNSSSPADTRSDFVVYDSAHKDYTYTPAYVRHLVHKCKTSDGFREATGRPPRAKPTPKASAPVSTP
ncbi:DUF3644 domain-containing protein [Arthrobacter sp. NicSoilC12]|uniref:DUF3644 domain-containing protein n=1 Tax=Arthrobacter sp. NicSoilC12 TaxID=2831001 RepID=UPI001CC69DF8|nr:DUF3644 domain-containing protein [Arthrobacter sp. NicSoilC12]GIU55665.1 hypothetical protein NicSoilC12_14140 [Arthrobacter sp. NicSoilC12]